MHPELEALIRAYDAAREAQGSNASGLRTLFENRLNEALAQRPQLNRETLLNLVRISHARWIRAQENPPALPPSA